MRAGDLRGKLNELALKIADDLLAKDTLLADRIDGLKTLTSYYATMAKQEPETPVSVNGKWGATNRVRNDRNASAN